MMKKRVREHDRKKLENKNVSSVRFAGFNLSPAEANAFDSNGTTSHKSLTTEFFVEETSTSDQHSLADSLETW